MLRTCSGSLLIKRKEVEDRKKELSVELSAIPNKEPILLHPSLAQVYAEKIHDLADSFYEKNTRPQAIELLRSLLSEVRLHPNENAPDCHDFELYGELAAILAFSASKNDEPRRFTGGVSVLLVAGVGFEPTTFRL